MELNPFIYLFICIQKSMGLGFCPIVVISVISVIFLAGRRHSKNTWVKGRTSKAWMINVRWFEDDVQSPRSPSGLPLLFCTLGATKHLKTLQRFAELHCTPWSLHQEKDAMLIILLSSECLPFQYHHCHILTESRSEPNLDKDRLWSNCKGLLFVCFCFGPMGPWGLFKIKRACSR